MVIINLQISLDPFDEDDRERAHAAVDAIYDGLAGYVDRKKGVLALDQRQLCDVMYDLAVGKGGSRLNPRERAMLRAIAQRAPDAYPYEDNRDLCGSGPKFGNVTSSITRRFVERGFAVPFQPTVGGFRMTAATAEAVLFALDATE